MTRYELTLRKFEVNPATGPHSGRVVARMESDDPAVMGAVLRSIADQVDPPRPVYRDRFRPEGYGAAGQPRSALDAVALAAYTRPVDVRDTPPQPRSPGSRITPDGCGPEHTFTGSCHLAGTPLPVVGTPLQNRCRGNDCDEQHTYEDGCLLA